MKGIRALLNRKGQSATEYILILAVLVAIIVVVAKYMPGKFKDLIDTAIGKVTGGINTAAGSGG